MSPLLVTTDCSLSGLKVTWSYLLSAVPSHCSPVIKSQTAEFNSQIWITQANYLTFICKMGVIITYTSGDQHDDDNLS